MSQKPKSKVYNVETLEWWSTQGTYLVQANSPEEAVAKIASGEEECLQHEHDGSEDSVLWASIKGKGYEGPGRVFCYALQMDGPMGPSYAGPFYDTGQLLRETPAQLDPGNGTIYLLEINVNGKVNLSAIDESDFIPADPE